MVIFSSQNINVQGHPSGDGEGIKYMGKHFGREIPNLFPLQSEVGHAVWSRTNVNDCAGEGLTDLMRIAGSR